MKPKIKAILIDVDDCLVPTDGRVWPPFHKGLSAVATHVWKGNGGIGPPISFCSGRDRNYIEAVAFFCGLPNVWSIIESGVALFNPKTKEMIMNPALTPEIKTAFDLIRRERLPLILDKLQDLFDYPGNIINIALERCNGAKLSIEEYFHLIEKEFLDLADMVTIRHSNGAVDISPFGVDKASGVSFFSKMTGISPRQMLGIGDSMGDLPMLEMVGYVGCPNNASKECKELVLKRDGIVAPGNFAAGVAKVIDDFIELMD